MKLYYVQCKNYKASAYVLAEHPTEAYEKLRALYEEKDWFFRRDRELESIKLIAEYTNYPDCEMLIM